MQRNTLFFFNKYDMTFSNSLLYAKFGITILKGFTIFFFIFL